MKRIDLEKYTRDLRNKAQNMYQRNKIVFVLFVSLTYVSCSRNAMPLQINHLFNNRPKGGYWITSDTLNGIVKIELQEYKRGKKNGEYYQYIYPLNADSSFRYYSLHIIGKNKDGLKIGKWKYYNDGSLYKTEKYNKSKQQPSQIVNLTW